MSELKATISPARLRAAPAYIAFLMLAIGAISFIDNPLFTGITAYFGIALPVSSLFVEIALVPAMLALASLRLWSCRVLKAVMCLSLALYLPAVIGISRIDLAEAAGYSWNFGALSGSLPPAAIALFGILIACGCLSLRSFAYAEAARDNFLKRGAHPEEIDIALYRHTLLEAKLIGAAAAAVMGILLGVTLLEPLILWVLQSAKFLYVLAGLSAALVLGLIILVYVRGVKR